MITHRNKDKQEMREMIMLLRTEGDYAVENEVKAIYNLKYGRDRWLKNYEKRINEERRLK